MKKQGRVNFSKPKVETTEDLLAKIGNLCNAKISSVDEALSKLSYHVSETNVFPSKALSFASKLSSKESDLASAWAEGVIQHLLVSAENEESWFSKPKSGMFLFGMNISAGTNKESQLRIIGDYVLTKFKPRNEKELVEHLRIASVFVQNLDNSFPYGSVFLTKKVVFDKDSFGFRIQQSIISSAVNLLEILIKSDPVRIIAPELLMGCNDGSQVHKIIETADFAKQSRIDEFLNQRVYPVMIQMIQPHIPKVHKNKKTE